MIDGVLVGFIFCAALTATVFFLKFWRETHDQLFLAFAAVFAIEGLTRLIGLFFTEALTDRVPIINLIRMAGYIVLIAAIVAKNRRPSA
jgi:hypothetical protein